MNLLADKTGSDAACRAIQEINQAEEKEHVKQFANFKDSVDELKKQKPAKLDWESKLTAMAAQTKQLICAAINEGVQATIDIIQNLPSAAQDIAGNFAIECSRFINNCLGTLIQQLDAVWHAVTDFLKGVFEALGKAYDIVAHAANAAISSIANLFKGGFKGLAGGP